VIVLTDGTERLDQPVSGGKEVSALPENTNDKGYRRMLGRKRNFLEFIKQHIAALVLTRFAKSRVRVNANARSLRGSSSPPRNSRCAAWFLVGLGRRVGS
jgi:hypothetical protein